MESENVAIIGSVGAAAGAVVNQKVSLPFGLSGQGMIPAIFGLAISALAYFFLEVDYLTEGTVGFGIGYSISAVL